MFSRYSFKTGSFFSLHPSLPAFLPFSLSSSFPAFLPFSLSPPLPLFPLSFLSFLENLLCSRHCVKRCASEGISVFKEGLVWWRGKHSAPRPPSSPPSVCFSTLWFCHWRFIGAQPRPFACTLSAAALALQQQP